jgi:cell division septum initiation protein DivIVA
VIMSHNYSYDTIGEEFPGQIDQLESYIRILEKENFQFLGEIRQLKERNAELETQIFGGSTK